CVNTDTSFRRTQKQERRENRRTETLRERERERERAMEAVVAAKPRVKVAALCGSLRKGSYNLGLVRSAIELSKSINGLEIEYIDIEPLPMLNTDLEGEGTF
ncbi:nadph:quinone oxidoreductase, partial [Quercus suber]